MTKEFYKWLGSLGVEPMLKKIYQNADEVIESTKDRASNSLLIFFMFPPFKRFFKKNSQANKHSRISKKNK